MKKKTISFGIFANFSRISAAVKNSESIDRARARQQQLSNQTTNTEDG